MLQQLYNLHAKLNSDLRGSYYPVPQYMKRIIALYPRPKQIVAYAKLFKGHDLTSIAPNALGCAESVSRIIHEVLPDFWIYTGTAALDTALKNDARFTRVHDPQPGDIFVSPTGSGNGKLAHGHTGICIENKRIMSNDSMTGKWAQNFTDLSWRGLFVYVGGFPVNIYRLTG